MDHCLPYRTASIVLLEYVGQKRVRWLFSWTNTFTKRQSPTTFLCRLYFICITFFYKDPLEVFDEFFKTGDYLFCIYVWLLYVFLVEFYLIWLHSITGILLLPSRFCSTNTSWYLDSSVVSWYLLISWCIHHIPTFVW